METLKSIALITLIAASLLMTSQLWLINSTPWQSISTPIDVMQPEPLEALAPWQAYIHMEAGSKQFCPGDDGFDKSWDLLRNLISGSTEVSVQPSTAADWQRTVDEGGVEFRLAGRVQLRMWLEALSIQPSGLSTEHYFSRLLISPSTNNIYFHDIYRGTFISWNPRVSSMRQLIEETVQEIAEMPGKRVRSVREPWASRVAPWVYVLESPGMWPEIMVRSERSRIASLTRRFFPDMSLVRSISERGGMTTYTDGRRAVYVYDDRSGAIEYVEPVQFTPIYDINSRASLILSSGLAFVARHGGWPEDYRLSDMRVATDGQVPFIEFQFTTYFRSPLTHQPRLIPLVAWRNAVGLRVTERNVSQYERFVYVPDKIGPWMLGLITAEDALRAAEAKGTLLPDALISDLYLAYYQREILQDEYLTPVWVIEQGAHRVLVLAYTGDVVTAP